MSAHMRAEQIAETMLKQKIASIRRLVDEILEVLPVDPATAGEIGVVEDDLESRLEELVEHSVEVSL